MRQAIVNAVGVHHRRIADRLLPTRQEEGSNRCVDSGGRSAISPRYPLADESTID